MKKFSKLLMFLLLAGVLSGCAEEVVEEELVLYEYSEDEYSDVEFKLESDDLVFELDKATTQFTVTQKSTGKVWKSNPDGAAEDVIADSAAKRMLQSTLVIEYSTINELATLLNTFEHSITNGIYSLEKTDDSIKVNYSIGKVSKKFIILPSVPEARMQEFYEQLDRSMQRKIDNMYRKVDINNLLATDNKDELLAKYPDLETTCVYELRPGVKDYLKEQLEAELAALGYTEEQYEADAAIYNVGGDDNKKVYNVSIVYTLKDNKLVVEVPFEDVDYNSEYPITELRLLPYFGAGTSDQEGYMVVPEGSGAIINFNNKKSNLSAYYAQLYGWDYGMKRDVVVDETRATFPAFGIAHSDGAVLAVIEEYSTLAAIQADVAGRRHSYNNVFASYEMVHGSKMDISAKNDTTIIAYEKELPEGGIKQTYYFLDGNTYSDMAVAYRESLLERYPDLVKTENTQAPISVELIAAVDRVKQVLGMPVTLPEVLTDFEDAKTILNEMAENGYSNLSLRYTGWLNGGINHSIPENIKVTSGMGGKKGLASLASLADSLGADLYLNGRTQNAYNSDLFDGFSKMSDAAKFISREVVEVPVFSNIWFGDLYDSRMDTHFLLRPSVCVTLMQSLADYAATQGVGVGYEDVGYQLSGDYNPRRDVTREASMDMQVAKLAEVKASGTPITMAGGNEYVLPYADLLTEVNLNGKDYLLLDAEIPFYEIAIHGLVDYTGAAINLSGDPTEAVLRAAESGAGLSFTFIAESADLLQGTEYMDYFGANYDGWKDKANAYAVRYEKEMAGLNNQFITEHRILAEGVTATVYEDNTVVYVNKNTTEYTDGTVTVPARDYLVERSGN